MNYCMIQHSYPQMKVLEHVERLKNGWNYPIEIICSIGYFINKGLIVDGTDHSLALYYNKQNEEE